MAEAPVSVVVNTLNEERRIRACLETVRWAAEIVVVDMESEDATREIAREFTDRVFTVERAGYVEPARAYAVQRATQPWILVLDADELVPVALRDRLLGLIRTDATDVVYVPRRNYFFGSPARGSGFGPLQDVHPRFFREGSVRFGAEIHGGLHVSTAARTLRIRSPDEALVHLAYTSIEHFVEKMNRYTTVEARSMWEGGKRPWGLAGLALRTIKEGAGRFILRGGWRDGLRGVELSLLMVTYRWITWMKYRTMRDRGSADPTRPIQEEYVRIAEEIANDAANPRG